MENQSKELEPPQDLAGYQHIVTGRVEYRDIVVDRITRRKAWANESLGRRVEDCPSDIYRKMQCPKHEGQIEFSKTVASEMEKSHLSLNNMWKSLSFKAKTSDEGKPPLAKLPWKALRQVANVQVYGHTKYGDFDNYKKGMEVHRNLSCAIRHIADYQDGIDLDKESGVHHLAHAACRILFALENIQDGTAIDERYKTK